MRFQNISNNLPLLWNLAIREIKIRYKSPLLGFLWMFLLPLSMVLIFKIVFSLIVKVPIPGYPFFIFLTLGVFPWNYFGMSISGTVNSLVDNEVLIKKVYFPRQIIPLSIVLGNLVNFAISNLIILIFLLFFHISISKYILLLPLVIVLETLLIAGFSLLFSSLQVKYRDVKFIVEILLLFWFYISPVFYPLSLVSQVSDKFFKYYLLNPLASIFTLYRIIYLKDYHRLLPPEVSIVYIIIYPLVFSIFILVVGNFVFSRMQRTFADNL
jgi:ABC-2 type transport system permease protein